MKGSAIMSFLVLLAVSSLAGQKEDVFSELDAKITGGLASDKWHYASKAFVRVLWEDYKKAHVELPKDANIHSVFGKMPDAGSYGDYVGSFRRGANVDRDFVRVSKSDSGRFFVELDGHRIPAVARNRSIFFTTGDVVYSSIPRLGDKPYCALEMFMLIRIDGKYYFTSPGISREKWMELFKAEKEN